MASAAPMLRSVREAWAAARGDEKTAALIDAGMPLIEARQLGEEHAASFVHAGEFQRLRYDMVLYINKELTNSVRVADVLAQPAKYHGVICADPLEPIDSNGKSTYGKARIYTNGVPCVNSFLHGGARYVMASGDRHEANIHADAHEAKEVELLSLAIEAAVPETFLVHENNVVCVSDTGKTLRIGQDLGLILSRHICFMEMQSDKKGKTSEVPCGLKNYQANNYQLAVRTPGMYGLVQKQVDVFASRPVFDVRTNRVISSPGYHAGMKLFMSLDGAFPALPEITTHADALTVMNQLLKAFEGFTVFNSDHMKNLDKAMIATMVLSAALRSTVLCPAFLVTAAWAGTGKTELTRAIIAGMGHRLSALKWSTDDNECTKILLAWAKDSCRDYLVIENHDTALYGSALEAMLDKPSNETNSIRMLGTNDMFCFNNTALVIANGNNLRPGNAAYARRCLTVPLEATDPPAWAGKNFSFGSPTEHILNNWRARHMSVLGIVQWFVHFHELKNGEAQSGGLNAYPDFDRLIRKLVIALYGVDVGSLMEGEVLDTREANDATDPKGALFYCAWRLAQSWLTYRDNPYEWNVHGKGNTLPNVHGDPSAESDKVGFTMSQLKSFIKTNNLDPAGKLNEVIKSAKRLQSAGNVNGLKWEQTGERDTKTNTALWRVVGTPLHDD